MMSENADPLMLDRQLCFAVYAAEHAFTRFYKPRLEAIGLTYPQYLVMLVLWERDGLSVKQVGARLYLDSGTLTPLLKRLESAGLVNRCRDSVDERQVMIFLTTSGRALKQKAMAVPLAAYQASGLDLDALDALKSDLLRLRQNLDAPGGDT